MNELRQIGDEQGPHPPLWRIITPSGETTLCYVIMDSVYSGAKGCHVWRALAWNNAGYREVYSEGEWETARLEALAQPVRPTTEIQKVILKSIKDEIITPRSGLRLYRETIDADEYCVVCGSRIQGTPEWTEDGPAHQGCVGAMGQKAVGQKAVGQKAVGQEDEVPATAGGGHHG
jgi:hypothetical protein